ncbi:glycosyltransferase family 2 protein [Paenibacillus sedimenti]|uniref:Glycosyltransferase family 2 protein n=1 Tax=Paenibacillus sedimenti TaxID=2770274 RepID=A0A926QIM4_9BACL|nr:glycosyltransferase family 2 protein [Paenibacillus sedimenti]MBD0379768.1 glycosyltransferase family 2 protein [Paenibacillus sedimenti]
MKRETIPVSVIIMTKNEERRIRRCLEGVKAFDEVFVVDSNSTDRTADIVNEMGAILVNFTWDGKYPKKKQWCLENLPFKHDWVIYVDADEIVTPEAEAEIKKLFQKKPEADGYFAGYDYIFMDKVLKYGHRMYKLILFNRNKGRFLDYDDLDAMNMWEVEGHYQPQIYGKTEVLSKHLIHFDHDSLFDYFAKHNRYSDWEAVVRNKGLFSNLNESQIAIRKVQKKIFNKMPMKWVFAFLHSYCLKLGLLDGKAGFHYALARSMYYWQVGIKMYSLNSANKDRAL